MCFDVMCLKKISLNVLNIVMSDVCATLNNSLPIETKTCLGTLLFVATEYHIIYFW